MHLLPVCVSESSPKRDYPLKKSEKHITLNSIALIIDLVREIPFNGKPHIGLLLASYDVYRSRTNAIKAYSLGPISTNEDDLTSTVRLRNIHDKIGGKSEGEKLIDAKASHADRPQ